MKAPWRVVAAVAGAVVVAGTALTALNLQGEDPFVGDTASFDSSPARAERGRYLALAGNCMGCHTARGGAPYAGGRGIETPFGTVYASNLTPSVASGIGTWSSAHFWRALHHGRSKNGRLLYPAFPYPNYTQVTRDDADAIFAYLRGLPAVEQPNRAHELRFPYDSQLALAGWRALFFRPGIYQPDSARTPEWNRGAYLVRGLGHCNACHASRNAFGATRDTLELGGGLIPMQNWYAPALDARDQAGVADWPTEHIVALLRDGVSPRASVMGPMADVVFRSTQHLSSDDLNAIALFLKALPPAPSAVADKPASLARDETLWVHGEVLYDKHCAQCHGDEGQGTGAGYPPLAGNRAVSMVLPVNVIQVVVSGGFLPSTAGNPRPHGMPPFTHVLDDSEIAAVTSYIRGAWGNNAAPVSRLDVLRSR